MTRLAFQLDAVGRGRVVVDGVDVSDQVVRLVLVAAAGRLTRVTLELAGGDVAGDADVELVDPGVDLEADPA